MLAWRAEGEFCHGGSEVMFRRIRARLPWLIVWLERRTLQQRLVAAYVFIILIPSIFVSTFILNGWYDRYLEEALRNAEFLLEMEHVHIENQIETMGRAAQLSISDKEVIYYLQETDEPPTAELIEFNTNAFANLMRIQFNNPNIEHLRLFATNPKTHEIWPIILHERRIQAQPWYPTVMARQGMEWWNFERTDPDVIQRYKEEPDSRQPKVSLLREIEIPKDHHVGIVQVDMLLSKFLPKVYGSFQDEHSQLFLFDRTAELYTKPGHPFLLHYGMQEDVIAAQYKRLAAAGQEQHLQFTYKDTPFLMVYKDIPRLDARLVNVISLEKVFSDIRGMRNVMIIVNIVTLLALSVTTAFIHSFILKKLHQLTDSLKKMRQGRFDVNLDIRGGGEVGELAHHVRKMAQKINELVADAVNKQAMTKEAELKSLRNQIDSHFLYNTLENIKMLAEIENQLAISDSLTSLGALIRYNLRWPSEYVTLGEEIEHVRNYVALMNLRFDEPVHLHVDVPPGLEGREVLKMMLQPIVENSLKYAWLSLDDEREKRIRLTAWSELDILNLEVTDNGCGLTEAEADDLNRMIRREEPEEAHAEPAAGNQGGIGLRNVHQRLELYYGKEYEIHISGMPGRGTSVSLALPSCARRKES